MGGRNGDYHSDWFAKEWNPVFSEDRDFEEDESWAELKRGIDADSEELDSFLEDLESSLPSSMVAVVRSFCQGLRLDDLKLGIGIAGSRRAAWLDDRSSARSSWSVRKYKTLQSATSLYLSLKRQRYGNQDMPDANRRLIYIPNLNPYYILALAETASYHQIGALRSAIWKYLAYKTSIRVKIPHRGYPIFQMEFHIPHLTLRSFTRQDESTQKQNQGGPRRQWSDLSFLEIESSDPQSQVSYGMNEAQMSFVICGSDHRRWVGYGFVDTDGNTNSDSEDLGEEGFSYEVMLEDRIASDGKMNANHPKWDPREYFLRILEIRTAQVLKEWEYLVGTVEDGIKRYRSQHQSTLSRQSINIRARTQNAKEHFDWTQKTMSLLLQMKDVISKSIKTWETFKSQNGDIGYFIDSPNSSSNCRTRLSLRVINGTFDDLQLLQETLLRLEETCSNYAAALQLGLTLESNESLQQNRFATALTTWITNPVSIAIALFSMPQGQAPFKLDSKYFTMAIIIIIVVIRLLLVVVGALPCGPLWWAKVTASMREWKRSTIANLIWVSRRRVHDPERND